MVGAPLRYIVKENKMNKKDATIGAVVYLNAKKSPLVKAKIIALIPNEDKLVVEYENGDMRKCSLSELLNHKEGILKNQALIKEEERLEVEWAMTASNCQDKINEATQLIKEATELRKSKNSSVDDMPLDLYELHDAVEDLGWQTSSMNC